MAESSAESIDRGEVHVWLTAPDRIVDPGLLRAYEDLLAPDEVARRRRFAFAAGRKQYLVARALVRTVLSRYARVAPGDWRFTIGDHGRPEIAPGLCELPLRFNVSHCTGLIACAVALAHDIGVDVECEDDERDPDDLAAHCFAAPELAAFRALPEERRRERFFACWTLKEAYVKARGLGLYIPLEQVWFDGLVGGPLRVAFDPALADDPAAWQFATWRPTPQHQMALAVRRAGPDLDARIRWVTPLA